MSIEKTGPKGYDYQYNITVLIALLELKEGNKIYVEKAGSEDATLIINNDILEIQMKREQSNLSMNKFVQWVCHFQERKSDNNLLHLLKSAKNTKVLFVTKSRCNDDVSMLVQPLFILTKHLDFKLNRKWKSNFVSALKSFTKANGGEKLSDERNRFCQEQGKIFENSYFYSDSINDLPLLELVDTPIAVTPDDKLRAHAQASNWQIID